MIPFSEKMTVEHRDGTRDPDTRRWSVSVSGTEQISAHIAPVTGSDRDLLPEGVITGNEKKVLSKTEIQTADEDAQPPEFADHVLIDGDRYEVINSEHYRKVIPHYEAIVIKL